MIEGSARKLETPWLSRPGPTALIRTCLSSPELTTKPTICVSRASDRAIGKVNQAGRVAAEPLTTDIEISAAWYMDSVKSASKCHGYASRGHGRRVQNTSLVRSHESWMHCHDSILSGTCVGLDLGEKGRVRGNLIVDFGSGNPDIRTHN